MDHTSNIRFTDSGAFGSLTTGTQNIALGLDTLDKITTAINNTALGNNALENATSNANTGIGKTALAGLTIGLGNVAVGGFAGAFIGSSAENTYIGSGSGQFTGSGVTAIGTIVPGSNYTDGTYTNVSLVTENFAYYGNFPLATIVVSSGAVTSVTITNAGSGISVGQSLIINSATAPAGLATGSGFSVPVTAINTVQRNTAVGRQTLQFNQNGSQNTAIGYRAGYQASGSDSLYLGYQAGSNDSQSNRLHIANSTGSLIEGNFQGSGNPGVTVNGTLTSTGAISASNLALGETDINRNSNTFKIRKNNTAGDALTIQFDPTGAGSNTFSFNGAMIITASGPSTSSDGGNYGQFGIDTNYLYICVQGGPPGTAVWKRVALSTF